jgi:hypothetical protein
LNCNWKAYKVFNNGKRAKAPYLEFEYDESEGVEEYFNTKFKMNFPEKFRRSKYMFLRGDSPQERTAEAAGLAEEAHKQQRNQVLNKQIKSLDAADKCCAGTVGALVYCKESDWQWEWAALEGGTSRYVLSLSPSFRRYADAQKWMETEISIL